MSLPQCAWACDDPQCDADCKPVVSPVSCVCENPSVTPSCSVSCATPYDTNACPNCEVRCTPDSACGEIQCEAITASWACRKPANCPAPTCELTCEQPSCPYTGPLDPWATSSSWWILWMVLGILLGLAILSRS